MPASSKIEINSATFKSNGLFAGLSEVELKELIGFFQVRQWPRGGRIINEGERGGVLYIVYQGGVDILKQMVSREGERAEKITALREGDTFGETVLLDQQPHSASVVANTDSIVLALDNADLHRVDPHIYATMLANLTHEVSRRLRTTDQYYAMALFSNHE